tara:strand:+ start:2669 stop:3193 length:525 start_codon:yes stop_codon:yes gene_type:complete
MEKFSSNSTHVFWITGISGSGKTTFSKVLQKVLNKNNASNIIIDGDTIRKILDKEQSYTKESRLKIAYIYSNLAIMIQKQNINVICSTISLFHEVQNYNRKYIINYKEILISRSIDDIKNEDIKKIYENKDNVVGVDIIPEFPENPDFLITDIPLKDLENEAEKIVKKFLNHGA